MTHGFHAVGSSVPRADEAADATATVHAPCGNLHSGLTQTGQAGKMEATVLDVSQSQQRGGEAGADG